MHVPIKGESKEIHEAERLETRGSTTDLISQGAWSSLGCNRSGKLPIFHLSHRKIPVLFMDNTVQMTKCMKLHHGHPTTSISNVVLQRWIQPTSSLIHQPSQQIVSNVYHVHLCDNTTSGFKVISLKYCGLAIPSIRTCPGIGC